MPDQTPIYGFTYPCPGEVISPLAFQTLANQIDAKLVQLQADYDAMLNRYNFDTGPQGPQVVPAGVDTVLTAALLNYVIPAAGLWIFRAYCQGSPAGTTAMRRLRLRQNAVVRFGTTANTEGNNFNQPMLAGPVVAAAGDTISLTYLFSGTVTETVFAQIDGKMLVRTA
jgi:hypothetical protein